MLALDSPVLSFGGQVSLGSAILRFLKALTFLPKPTKWLWDSLERGVMIGYQLIARGMALLLCLICFPLWAAESLGNLAQYPPRPIDLQITTGSDGAPKIEPSEIVLDSGRYYRLAINCPDVEGDLSGWRIEMPELLNNAHLRLVTVGDIEVHLQGLSFNAIECDEIGSAQVSFVPIKPGVYPLYVGNVPLAVGRPIGESGVQTQGQFRFGSVKVR